MIIYGFELVWIHRPDHDRQGRVTNAWISFLGFLYNIGDMGDSRAQTCLFVAAAFLLVAAAGVANHNVTIVLIGSSFILGGTAGMLITQGKGRF